MRRCFTWYAQGSACPACALELHSTTRLARHWARSPACFAEVQAFTDPMTEVQLQEQEAEKRRDAKLMVKQGFRPCRAILPAFRPEGPQLLGRAAHLDFDPELQCPVFLQPPTAIPWDPGLPPGAVDVGAEAPAIYRVHTHTHCRYAMSPV